MDLGVAVPAALDMQGPHSAAKALRNLARKLIPGATLTQLVMPAITSNIRRTGQPMLRCAFQSGTANKGLAPGSTTPAAADAASDAPEPDGPPAPSSDVSELGDLPMDATATEDLPEADDTVPVAAPVETPRPAPRRPKKRKRAKSHHPAPRPPAPAVDEMEQWAKMMS